MLSSKDIFKLQNGNDIRGVAVDGVAGESVNLTPNICTGISHAFSFWLSRKTGKPLSELTIALGRDSRISGESLLNACVKGITNLGCTAINCGLATTPSMFMSLVFPETNYDGAIMVTASHLPYNRNGLKFFSKDGALESIDIKNILQLTRPDNDESFYAPAKSFDILSLYSRHLKKKICESLNSSESSLPLKDLHIVVDAGNGAAGFFANKVLSSLGCNTSGSQFLEADGMFPNHIPNPENKEAMLAIKKAVVENHADLGIIFDTDGDRMSCVLGNGIEVNREAAIALFSAILAPDFPKSTVVTDSVTSDRLTNFLENILGLKHLRYMRGYKNVINKCKELNSNGITSPLAMETSGHGALKDNYYLDDGAYLALLLVVALAKAKKSGQSLSTLIEKFPRAYEEREYRLKICTEDFRNYGMQALKSFEERAKNKGYHVCQSYEGVRLSFSSVVQHNTTTLATSAEIKNEQSNNIQTNNIQGWLLLRMSLHDPVMALNIEGEKQGDLEKIFALAKELLADFSCISFGTL